MASKPEGDNNVVVEDVDVSNVRRNWRVFEDYGVAYNMQQNEFSQHFDLNRFERRTMQVDTRLSKNEQKLEDKYAAEYREQLRRDLEKEDERLALELQKQLEMEERSKAAQNLQKLSEDEELARKMQEMEATKVGRRSGAMSNLVQKSASGNRIVLPPGLTPETIAAIEDAQRDGTPLQLPPNMSSEQLKAIRLALKDEDSRLAQEVQDYELALYLQKKEKAFLDAERQRKMSQEQVQNLQNQTYVAATKGTILDHAASARQYQPNKGEQRLPSRSVSSTASSGCVKSKGDCGSDLINFDDNDESFPPPPPPISNNGEFKPQRPPPPNFSPTKRNVTNQPTVCLAGSSGNSPLHPTNPFYAENNSSVPRDPSAMGGVRVLPQGK